MRAIAAENAIAPGEALRNLRSSAPISPTFDPSAGMRLSKRGQVDRSKCVPPAFGLPSASQKREAIQRHQNAHKERVCVKERKSSSDDRLDDACGHKKTGNHEVRACQNAHSSRGRRRVGFNDRNECVSKWWLKSASHAPRRRLALPLFLSTLFLAVGKR
jgi:hypothetical protein